MQINPVLKAYIETLNFDEIRAERKELLSNLSDSIASNSCSELVFVCTHNSRRSQLAQAWMTLASIFFNLNFTIHSAGTEVTICYQETVNALKRAGFTLNRNPKKEQNTPIQLNWNDKESLILFSKTISDITFKTNSFAAIMTCGEAEKNCPFIPGAAIRFPLTYIDPKQKDHSPEMEHAYDQTCRQIASELFYLCTLISKK